MTDASPAAKLVINQLLAPEHEHRAPGTAHLTVGTLATHLFRAPDLATLADSVAAIAAQVGFADQSSLDRHLRKPAGLQRYLIIALGIPSANKGQTLRALRIKV